MLLSALLLAPLAAASVGDRLPEFAQCCHDCESETCLAAVPSLKYAQDSTNAVSAWVFGWDCASDCNYKCQQRVCRSRQEMALPTVQFYGKWPFKRVLGITELFSTVFSLLNWWVNYTQLQKVTAYYRTVAGKSAEKATMTEQYMALLVLSLMGWTFSTLFHIRDTPLTETLDYAGASSMSVANCSAVVIRYYGLHWPQRMPRRAVFHVALVVVLLFHYTKLYVDWNYAYNMRFNVAFGLASVIFWILHSLRVNREYRARSSAQNHSMYIVPYETNIMAKLKYLNISKAKTIPLIPLVLNMYLLAAVCFEVLDFEPIFSLVDAHSLWHFFTIFPPIIWYDWNIWDLECEGLNKPVC